MKIRKSDVMACELYLDLDGETWEELYLPILEKMEMYEDDIYSYVEELTPQEHRFIADCLNLEAAHMDFYNENKVFCVYQFIKKLMMAWLDGTIGCETVKSYFDSLAKLVKNY